jgi:hypothetical protein
MVSLVVLLAGEHDTLIRQVQSVAHHFVAPVTGG